MADENPGLSFSLKPGEPAVVTVEAANGQKFEIRCIVGVFGIKERAPKSEGGEPEFDLNLGITLKKTKAPEK